MFLTALAPVAFCSCIANSASAEILIGNLHVGIRDSTLLASPEYWAAQSFTTDDTEYSLDSVRAMVGNGLDSPAIVAELRDDSVSSEVGSLVSTLIAPDVSGAISARTFLPSGAVTLTSNTTYWILLGVSNSGSFEWSYAVPEDALDFVGLGSVRGPNSFADSSDAGGSWNYYELGAFAGSGAYLFEVNATPVPEPSTLALLVSASAALLLCARSSRARRSSSKWFR